MLGRRFCDYFSLARDQKFLFLPLLLSLAWITGCQPAETVTLITGKTMGTTYRVSILLTNPSEQLQSTETSIKKELEKINRLMSNYDFDSELSRFNVSNQSRPFFISPETLEVVQFSLFLARVTGGAFDPTVGPLVDLWGFGPPGSIRAPPTEKSLQETLQIVGYEALVLDANTFALSAQDKRRLDLSAVAKGYAVDQISKLLDRAGYSNYLVEIGGELRSKGTKQEDLPWRVAVELPERLRGSVYKTLPLINQAIATSGDYRNYFQYEQKHFSHTIDPRTGSPVTHSLTSVTVLADSAMEADGWATALSVLGPVEGAALADQRGVAALMLVRDGSGLKLIESQAFKDYIEAVR